MIFLSVRVNDPTHCGHSVKNYPTPYFIIIVEDTCKQSSIFTSDSYISSRGPRKEKLEDRYFVYGIAMTPFALNIPAEKVDFTVNLAIIHDPDAVRVSANELANERSDDRPYFPIGYHEYFKAVCSRATGVQEIWDVPPFCLGRIQLQQRPTSRETLQI